MQATNFTLQTVVDSAIINFVICAGLVYRYYSGFPSLRVTETKTLCLQRFSAVKERVKQKCHVICQVIKFYTCRVSLSVELLVPNQTRRVRLPYPAPCKVDRFDAECQNDQPFLLAPSYTLGYLCLGDENVVCKNVLQKLLLSKRKLQINRINY